MLFENYIPGTAAERQAFAAKVREVAAKLGTEADWLMGAMFAESELKPTARNPYSGATGLIQFMPATAHGLGTTTAALAAMSAVEQLDYVRRYFASFPQQLKAAKDWLSLYLVVFYPAAVGKPDAFVLGSQVSPGAVALIAKQNAIYAQNGQVTVGSIRAHFEKRPGFGTLKKNA